MARDLVELNRRLIRARIHIEGSAEFVNRVIIDQDHSAYPDPYIGEVKDKELISTYFRSIQTAVAEYDAENNEEAQALSEFYRREQNRLNTQIGRLTVNPPDFLVQNG